MTETAPDLTATPHSIKTLFVAAREQQLTLEVTTTDGSTTTGVATQATFKDNTGLLTLVDDQGHPHFLLTHCITKITPRKDSRMHAL